MVENIIKTIDMYANTQPNQVVYDFLGDTHTYADLKAQSDSLAAYIETLALPEKSPVLVYGGQQFEMLVSFLALSKSGHAYMPVDVESAADRINAILEIGKPAAILAIDALPSQIEVTDLPVVNFEELTVQMQANNTYELTHPVMADDTYYIIFTSGTTGKPKGVQISHTNLLSFTNWMITDNEFMVPDQPQMLAQPPYSFDLSVMYWAPTLAKGGTLFALPKDIISDFQKLFAYLPKLPIQVWTSTPSFAEMAMLSEDFCAEKMPTLTHFYFCGEELTVKTAQKLHARFPKARIINSYGPTEATVALSAIAITEAMLTSGERLPIGLPKPGSTTVVLDEDGNVLPAGEQGEIIIAGPNVSKGYLNNPEKTAAVFFEYEGQPAYHTGDLGSFDADGVLQYGGRMDFQIKFNGFRIELEEVSHVLNLSPYVKAAVAVPRYNKEHKVQQLLAYVVVKEDVDASDNLALTKAIKESLKDLMMPYMMPSRFIYREDLPITPNGKINIKSLIAEVNNR
ncbi:D-alanine--poly(phosphoribitol) ligase subunit DltA [Periweissella fabalis]|uniref:D-alanine--D-alanyl carrier protein ligase n=1 Tax=Periweissella fabalis TaxID=1070421 RepID=A0A7X6N1D3_9LACO|nr:D-alanine--poly(phosphoribitol) ligase subunit DltA [Periweissella fabalis]MCM0599000.1 D-alanine--poly(phosphoribitol) ligase subunit DltA [Periweissella fabalis]NKZ23280.1 D-alanine--poly(phosphoribitol) ligase subunit DltA [Periweissella fabalis]